MQVLRKRILKKLSKYEIQHEIWRDLHDTY